MEFPIQIVKDQSCFFKLADKKNVDRNVVSWTWEATSSKVLSYRPLVLWFQICYIASWTWQLCTSVRASCTFSIWWAFFKNTPYHVTVSRYTDQYEWKPYWSVCRCWVIDVRTDVPDVLVQSSKSDKSGTNSQSPLNEVWGSTFLSWTRQVYSVLYTWLPQLANSCVLLCN